MASQELAGQMSDFEGGAKIGRINEQKNKVIADEDERWEKMLMKQCDEFLDGGEMNRLKGKLEEEKKKLRKAKRRLKKKDKKDKDKKEKGKKGKKDKKDKKDKGGKI